MKNNRVRMLTLMLVILAVGSIVLAACARPGTPSGTASSGNSPAGGNNGGASGGGNTVHMSTVNFVVSSTNISKGSKLTLIDDVASPHIIKNGMWDASGTQKLMQEPGAPAVSVNFSTSGESHDIGPFTTAGTYRILCTVHPNMNLTVIVK